MDCYISSFFVIRSGKILMYVTSPDKPGHIDYSICTSTRSFSSTDLGDRQVIKLLSFLEEFEVKLNISAKDNYQVMTFSYLDALGKETPVSLQFHSDHTYLFVNGVCKSYIGNLCIEIAKQEERKRVNVV